MYNNLIFRLNKPYTKLYLRVNMIEYVSSTCKIKYHSLEL